MKSINAPLVSVSYDAIELAPENRARFRGHSKMASASGIKREVRRKQRHFLGAQLLQEVQLGLQDMALGIFPRSRPEAASESADSAAADVSSLFLIPVGAGVDPSRLREVTVIRKGSARRKIVETLSVHMH